MVPDGTNPWPDPMLTSRLWCFVAVTWEQFYSAQATTLYDEFENQTFEITATSSRGQWLAKVFQPMRADVTYVMSSLNG